MSKLSLSVQPKVKKPSLSKSKKKAWTIFSKYIRTRDAIKTTGGTESCKCVTCGHVYPLKGRGLQAGHFLPGRHANLLFNEFNCHAQCVICNLWRRGEYGKYLRFMKKEYGDEKINELLDLDEKTTPMKAFQYEELYLAYKDKLTKLLDNSIHGPLDKN